VDDAALLDSATADPADVVASRAPMRGLVVVVLVLAVIAALVVTARVATDRAARDAAFAHHQALSISAWNAMSQVMQGELRKPFGERDVVLMSSGARVGNDSAMPGSTYGVDFPRVTTQLIRMTPLMIVASTTITSDGFTDTIYGKFAVSADGQSQSVDSCTKGNSAIGTGDDLDCTSWAASAAP
jgi:hypothetical protein